MKKVIKQISWWLVLPFFSLVVLIGCKSREKAVQKTETQSEKKSEASFKIEDKTFEIVLEKELTNSIKTNFVQNYETKKDEKKDVQIIREYYENGNLKSEIQKSFSEFSEATKTAIEEMNEKISTEIEKSKYWENSSNHYYQLLEEEKQKNSTKNLSVKSKLTYTWQLFFSGLFLGWLLLPKLFRWIWSLLLRFVPFANFIEWIKTLKK